MDRSLICHFTFFSTAVQSYQADGPVTVRNGTQSEVKKILPPAGLKLGTA